ncbi:metalloregulator ArsR/SmtB family transcription factor [soil metagenome]
MNIFSYDYSLIDRQMLSKPVSLESFCASKLKVLADPTRLAVMGLLLKGPKHVSEINALLNMNQSLLSHHLQALRKAGLVEGIRDGKSVCYQLAPGVESVRSGEAINLGCCMLSFDKPSKKRNNT